MDLTEGNEGNEVFTTDFTDGHGFQFLTAEINSRPRGSVSRIIWCRIIVRDGKD